MQKINLYIVEYLNSLPFLKGLDGYHIDNLLLNINKAIPALCAKAFHSGEADIALLPIGALLENEYSLFSDYCIGCDGHVQTVCVFSNKPSLDEIKTIAFDPASRTSNLLLEILLKYHWKNNDIKLMDPINHTDAKLIIGDAAFIESQNSKTIIDLGAEWKKFTGLPFVFAVWVSKNTLNPKLIEQFNQCFEFGLKQIADISENYKLLSKQIAFEYLTKYISYSFDEKKKQALNLFLYYANELSKSKTVNTFNA